MEYNNISEIEANQTRVHVKATVKEISPVKEFSNFDRIGRLATALIENSTGTIQLTLWNEQIDLVKIGDIIEILNGYVKEYKGEKQLNIGKYGKIESIE